MCSIEKDRKILRKAQEKHGKIVRYFSTIFAKGRTHNRTSFPSTADPLDFSIGSARWYELVTNPPYVLNEAALNFL